MPRGWCWWVVYPYITRGQWPMIQIGNQKILWTPGMGWGWLMWYSMLAQQQPQMQSIQSVQTSKEDEIEYLKRLKEELEAKLEEIKRRLEELERK